MEKHDHNLMVVNSSVVSGTQLDNMLFCNLDAFPRMEIDLEKGKGNGLKRNWQYHLTKLHILLKVVLMK